MVSVVGIVVTRDGATVGGLARCLDSLREAGALPLVTDEASIDGTASLARKHGAEVRSLPAVGPGRLPWGGRDEPAARLDALRWAGDYDPRWAIFLDDDEWLLSPRTVGQMIREQIARPQVGCYYYRTLHFWDSLTRVKGWRQDPLDIRPRAWRWDSAATLELFPRELHSGQVPRYANDRAPAWLPNICVGHLGYVSRELREKKAALYLSLSGPADFLWSGSELLTDEGVLEFDWQTVKGLP